MKQKKRRELRDAEINYRGRAILVLSYSVALSIIILCGLAGVDILRTGELSDNTGTFLLPIFTGLLGVISGFVASKATPLQGPDGTTFDNPFEGGFTPTPPVAPVAPALAEEVVVEGVEDIDGDSDEEPCEDCDDDTTPVDPDTGIPINAEAPDSEDPGMIGAPTTPEFGGEEADFFDEDGDSSEFDDIDIDVTDDEVK